MKLQNNTKQIIRHNFLWLKLLVVFVLLNAPGMVKAQNPEDNHRYFSHFKDVNVKCYFGTMRSQMFLGELDAERLTLEVKDLLRKNGIPITDTWNDKSTHTLRLVINARYTFMSKMDYPDYFTLYTWHEEISAKMITPADNGNLAVELSSWYNMGGGTNINDDDAAEEIYYQSLGAVNAFIETWKKAHQ